MCVCGSGRLLLVCFVCVVCVCVCVCVLCVCCVCVDELKLHSNMCVHECARCAVDLPSWPTNWTAQLGSTAGQHHWPALLTAPDSTTDQHHCRTVQMYDTGVGLSLCGSGRLLLVCGVCVVCVCVCVCVLCVWCVCVCEPKLHSHMLVQECARRASGMPSCPQ